MPLGEILLPVFDDPFASFHERQGNKKSGMFAMQTDEKYQEYQEGNAFLEKNSKLIQTKRMLESKPLENFIQLHSSKDSHCHLKMLMVR